MANKPVEVHPLADQEAAEAFDYYEQRDVRVAERFKRELERCLAAIEARPFIFQLHLLRTRRCVLRKFPFLIIFRETAGGWFVLAVAQELKSRIEEIDPGETKMIPWKEAVDQAGAVEGQ